METKVATIPRVVVAGAFGPKDYGVLLTDQRMIFVLESSSKAALAGALGGAVGAVIAGALQSRRSTNSEANYQDADPEELAGHEKSLVVPYAGIESLTVERKFGSYRLLVEFVSGVGKRKKIAAMIAPPATTVSQNKTRGVGTKDTAAEYARTVQAALQKALPPSVARKASWRL
jgi:hypothetical protein